MEAVEALESVLKRDPDNIGANHFYIHAVEESPHPEQAMASARKMAVLAPGAGHLVHMPAHIYIRTGDYHAATVSNQQAIGADRGYIDKYHVDGMYAMMYYTHNMHFLAVSASMEGDFEHANRVAAQITHGVMPFVKEHPETQNRSFRHKLWCWCGSAVGPRSNSFPSRTRAWTRRTPCGASREGWLSAVKGKPRKRPQNARPLPAEVKAIPAKEGFRIQHRGQIFDIATWMLDANIARGRRDYKQAAALLTKAALAEDALNYDEPPDWYLPPRESLGRGAVPGRPSGRGRGRVSGRAESPCQESTRAFRSGGVSARAGQGRRGSRRSQGI
jgi:tetratricopeptide (TPR) repeat protein